MHHRQHALVLVLACIVLATSCTTVERVFMRTKPKAWPEDAAWPAWAAAHNRASRVEPLTAKEAEQWLRWALPLPKRVRFQGKLTLPTADLKFVLRNAATDVEHSALDELTTSLAKATGAKAFGGEFRILVGVCDAHGKIDGTWVPGAKELAGLPNADQAYVITPLPRNGMAVAALTERGVYHGLRTLQQLLEPHAAKGKLTLPMVAILDWPDLAERGLWGGSANRDIQYLADRKMNLIEAHTKLSLNKQGRGVAGLDATSQNQARLHAIKWVPIITHLDQLGRTGLYQRYPELMGKGPDAKRKVVSTVIAPCFAQPKTAEVLADWFADLAATKGVSDICVWLSEHHVHCSCPQCKAKGQYFLEADACVRAWQLARKKHPHVRLRILLTQGSYTTNDKVLAAASPPEVGITYYDGGRTYDSSRDPMIYPLLEEFARKGRWLGCYPQLTTSWRVVCPWSGPQFIKYRMTEFVDKGLQCLCGYATPDNRFYDFNVTAAAEWSWNAHGRTPREFALAWATRRRLADPEKAADWATMLGPVGWDVYGSRIPYTAFFSDAKRMVQRRSKPGLGKGMFRYFPTVQHIDHDLAICDRAMKLATELDDPAILTETRTIRGYVRMVKAIHAIANAVAGKKTLPAAEAKRLQVTFDSLAKAGLEVADGLVAWKAAVAPDHSSTRVTDTANVTHQTVDAIGVSLAPFGIKDTGKPYREHTIGGWKTEDFDQGAKLTKTWDVTDSLDGPGTYRVRFAYTRGWNGLSMYRVALAASAKAAPDKLTVMADDTHTGFAAHKNRSNVYTLKLARYDPKARYIITADIKGTPSKGRPTNRQGCCGDVWMVKDKLGHR